MRYEALIDRYAYIIRGQFYGHMECDEFQLVQSYLTAAPAGVTLSHAALTTYMKGNPSYRIYYMDKPTSLLLDYDQYRFYINQANRQGIIQWKIAYQFKRFYEVPDMSSQSFLTITHRMKVNIYIYI